MPPFLTIFLFIVAFAVFAGLWGMSLISFLIGLWLKKRWLKWLGGIPLVGLSLLGVLVVGIFAWGVYESHSPPRVFEDSFGFAAPKSTQFDSGYWSEFGDSGIAELKFHTDTNTFQKIIATGFIEITGDEFRQSGSVPSATFTRYFKKDPFGKNFAHDVAYIAIDDRIGAVYFRWDGID